MKVYNPPSWGKRSVDGCMYSLEILKNGLMIDTIELDKKDYYVIGRQPDVCDIGLDHPSISRIHAVIQHHENGYLMIIDMNSAHGTFVNKKEINKSEYHRLFVGDFIKFGASTRSYIVQGPDDQKPEEYDSENMRAYRQKLVDRSAEIKAKKEEENSNGISWGFREDAQNYDDDDNHIQDEENLPDYIKNDPNYDRKFGERFSSSIVDSEVSEKDLELLEKLRKKEKKIQNMQQEISRIYMKENNQENGLTAGQLAAIERNDRRIEQLIEQVESIEKTLKEKKNQREVSKHGVTKITEMKKKKKDDEGHSDDDERLDTTQQTMDVSTNWRLKKKKNEGNNQTSVLNSILSSSSKSRYNSVTYEQLCQERDLKQSRYNTLMKEIQQHEEIIRQGEDINETERDELEKYLLTSRREESQKAKQECLLEAQVVMSNLLELEKYIQIAAPALPSLLTKESHLNGTTTLQSETKIEKEQENCSSELKDHQPALQESSETPVHCASTLESSKKSSTKRNRNSSMMAVHSSSINWDNPKLDDDDEDLSDSPQGKKGKSEINKTEPPIQQKIKSVIGPSMPHKLPIQSNYSFDQLEGGDTVWVPPKNQSGDGKTALNAKYGY